MRHRDIPSGYRRAWWALLLRGIFGLVLGGFLLLRPGASVAALALLIAVWAFAGGLVEIAAGIQLRHAFSHWPALVAGGLVSVAFGVAALIDYPVLALAFAVAWVASWLMLSGLVALYVAMRERQAALPWGPAFAWGITGTAAAALTLVEPPVTLAAIVALLSAVAILTGLSFLFGAARLTIIRRHAPPPHGPACPLDHGAPALGAIRP